ncbi:MAG: hypothetical protein VW877_01255 [Pseudomonadaceae bacterium]
MNNTSSVNAPRRHLSLTVKVALVLLALLIPFGGALLVFANVVSANTSLQAVDLVFCMATLTNCQEVSPFYDLAGWRELLIRNGVIFSIWLLYAVAVYGFFNAAQMALRVFAFAFVVLIPLGFAGLGLLIILLQGAHM